MRNSIREFDKDTIRACARWLDVSTSDVLMGIMSGGGSGSMHAGREPVSPMCGWPVYRYGHRGFCAREGHHEHLLGIPTCWQHSDRIEHLVEETIDSHVDIVARSLREDILREERSGESELLAQVRAIVGGSSEERLRTALRDAWAEA